jgi:hypothetical protein
MNRRVALIALVSLVVIAAAWRLTRPAPPTDEQLVRVLFEEAALAAEAGRVSDAVAGLSERFRGQGLDRQGVKRLVAANTLQGSWRVVRLAGIRVEVAGDTAGAVLDLVATRAGPGKALADLLPADGNAWRVEARLEREPDGWRVVGATWAEESLVDALAGPEAAGAARDPAAR